MTPFDQIVSAIFQSCMNKPIVLISIDGCGAAGKSTLAQRLSAALGSFGIPAQVVHFDDFYLPTKDRPSDSPEVGAHFDWRRLRDSVLSPLRVGGQAAYFRYDWGTDTIMTKPTRIVPNGVVLIEGVYSGRNELAAFYDLRIWVACSRDLRLRRGIERDGESARSLWEDEWMPEEDRYVHEHDPIATADFIVNGYET